MPPDPDSDTDSVHSTFSKDHSLFSLSRLSSLVAAHLGTPCTLSKLAEGGNHKVYDVNRLEHGKDQGQSTGVVVRVPSNDFPIDKLESEVATLKYIKSHTTVPVPMVLGWDSTSNHVGAEYMILEKVPGIPANTIWSNLPLTSKESLVRDVARYLLQLFKCRFSTAGSLFLSGSCGRGRGGGGGSAGGDGDDGSGGDGGGFKVGPLITTPFFRALDGQVRFPEQQPALNLSQFRGPFTSATGYLSSGPKTELYVLKAMMKARRGADADADAGVGGRDLHDGLDEERLALGIRVLEKVLRLVEIYPGDAHLISSEAERSSFSLRLADFRLANIMVDERSGEVQGFIDFEGTTVAPLWMCTGLPCWLEQIEGGAEEENHELAHLRQVFTDTMKAEGGQIGEEWLELMEKGELFRQFGCKLDCQVLFWASEGVEKWVDRRLAFALLGNPGVGLPELTVEEEIAERYGFHS